MKIIIIIAIVFFNINAFCMHPTGMVDMWGRTTPKGFKGQGDFVEVPAEIGLGSLYIPGTAVFISITYLPSLAFGMNSKMSLNSSALSSMQIFGTLGYYNIGTPFWLVKKTFWDFPMYFWESIFEEEEKVEQIRIEDVP